MRVTVQGDKVIKLQGDPDHPTTNGALCTKVSRYAERTDHAERVLQPLKRVGPKGEGQFVEVSWDEALDDIAARLGEIAARAPEAILPYSYAGTMGMVQGEGMAARFFNKLGASRLDRTICSSAGGEALARHLRRQGGHARRALRREQADRHLGQQLDRVEPAFLADRAGRQARRRARSCASTRAAPRRPRSATSTSR